jgi:hypothetical protein
MISARKIRTATTAMMRRRRLSFDMPAFYGVAT